MKQITQAEARAWRQGYKRLAKYIENQRNRWTDRWPAGNGAVYLGELDAPERVLGWVEVARKLKHPAVVTLSNSGKNLELWADPVQAAREIVKGQQ